MGTKITFDRSLYLPEAVAAAVAAYADHAQIETTSSKDAVVAEVSPKSEIDPTLLVNAFCNHALYETIARLRQGTLQEG